ncbi:hypothetical protein EB796_008948 [Bugula neritina]|uniref:Uncharacterized protein n=1 Tax=Bugula neritina TaxID=10212 RepID=A0A7J7K262_BUGNE|nr:hypothetical protein EB796_008948 [Bugula neritina]
MTVFFFCKFVYPSRQFADKHRSLFTRTAAGHSLTQISLKRWRLSSKQKRLPESRCCSPMYRILTSCYLTLCITRDTR